MCAKPQWHLTGGSIERNHMFKMNLAYFVIGMFNAAIGTMVLIVNSESHLLLGLGAFAFASGGILIYRTTRGDEL